MTHEVVLQGYNVKPGSLQLGTFDSYGIEKIHVTADDEWAGLEILAVFHAPGGTSTKVVVGADGMLAVPPEATAKQAGGGRIVFAGLSENAYVTNRNSRHPHRNSAIPCRNCRLQSPHSLRARHRGASERRRWHQAGLPAGRESCRKKS